MLYKYYPIERRDVFRDRLIRFTQPGEFNDPFELLPSYDLMSKAEWAALPEAPGQEGGPKQRILTSEALQAMLAPVVAGLEAQMARLSGREGAHLIDNNKLAQATFDSRFGILCLSETPDSLLMWAHYANNHNGFVIQFDEAHEFFSATVHEGQKLPLTKVEYSSERPVLSYSSLGSPVAYYRKSPEWAYENEWRIVKSLRSANKTLRHHEYPRCLFEIPPLAVKGVILGVRVPHAVRVELIDQLNQPPWGHLNIFQTALNKNDYRLDILPPLGGYPPEAISGVACVAR